MKTKERVPVEISTVYPFNIIYEILEQNPDLNKNVSLELYNKTISACLDERTKRVVELYYRDGLTQLQIGEQLGISGTRAAQIKDRALEALKRHWNDILCVPYSKYMKALEKISELEYEIKDSRFEEEEKKEREAVDKTPVVLLGLSKRSCNALTRVGVKDVGQIRKLTVRDLQDIRGLGAESINEIIRTMENIGVTIAKK